MHLNWYLNMESALNSDKNKNVYEGHYGNYATHCPRWSEMLMEEKAKIARVVGFCHGQRVPCQVRQEEQVHMPKQGLTYALMDLRETQE